MLGSSLQALRSTLFIWGSVYRGCDLALWGGGLGVSSHRPRCLFVPDAGLLQQTAFLKSEGPCSRNRIFRGPFTKSLAR
jgi:hypothetical protein